MIRTLLIVIVLTGALTVLLSGLGNLFFDPAPVVPPARLSPETPVSVPVPVIKEGAAPHAAPASAKAGERRFV